MNRFTRQMASYLQQFGAVVRNEFRTIFTDGGVLLILVFAMLIYATAYSLAYGSQVLRNVPIGVVDACRTATSRSLIETFNAGPNTYVAYEPTDMEEARELFYGRKIYGVVDVYKRQGQRTGELHAAHPAPRIRPRGLRTLRTRPVRLLPRSPRAARGGARRPLLPGTGGGGADRKRPSVAVKKAQFVSVKT